VLNEGFLWKVDFHWIEDDETFYDVQDNISNYLGVFDEALIVANENYLLPTEVDNLFIENPEHWIFSEDSEFSEYYQYEYDDQAYFELETYFGLSEDKSTYQIIVMGADYYTDITSQHWCYFFWNGWPTDLWYDLDGNVVDSYDYESLDCWATDYTDEEGNYLGFVWNAKGISLEIMENLINYKGVLDSDYYVPWSLEDFSDILVQPYVYYLA
jgi:hypothetical protein